jgi:uncharacterized membrane protein
MEADDPRDGATQSTAGSGTDGSDRERSGPDDGPVDYDIEDALLQLDRLEATVTSETEQREVERTRHMLEQIPGSDHIHKYTSRDVGEAFVGGILFALPLLVEGGVFEIAEWFTEVTVGPVPVVLVANLVFVVVLTTGLLYAVDLRTVRVYNPILGFIPRRLAGVLGVSLLVAAGAMFMWGRLHEGDPTTLERASRISVVWAAAALGAVLADILPGESEGEDIGDLID